MAKKKKSSAPRVCGFAKNRCTFRYGKLYGPSDKCQMNTATKRCKLLRPAKAKKERRKKTTKKKTKGHTGERMPKGVTPPHSRAGSTPPPPPPSSACQADAITEAMLQASCAPTASKRDYFKMLLQIHPDKNLNCFGKDTKLTQKCNSLYKP